MHVLLSRAAHRHDIFQILVDPSRQYMLRTLALWLALSLLIGRGLALDQYYYESVSYSFETSPLKTYVTCSMQVVALDPGLSSLTLRIPYPQGHVESGPTILMEKSVVKPAVTDLGNATEVCVNLPRVRVGQMVSLTLQYSLVGGTEIRHGSRLEVRTLDLDANVSEQALGLKLPKGFTISRIEVLDGSYRPGASGAVVDLGSRSATMVFVVRRTTILDSPYVLLAMFLSASVFAVGWALAARKRRLASRTA